MDREVVVSLINNAALLLALGVLYDAFPLKPKRMERVREVLSGMVIGVIAIALMLNALTLAPGVIFDTRSVLLSLSGLFFGFMPTAIAAVIAGVYRAFQGGATAAVGIGVIVSSSLLGLAWRGYRARRGGPVTWLDLYLLGIVVHVVMLGWMLVAPEALAWEILRKIGIPVMIIYPVGTVLLGRLLARQGERRDAEQVTQQRERRFRKMVEQGWDLICLTDAEGTVLYASDSVQRMLGLRAEAMLGGAWQNRVHPDDAAGAAAAYADLLGTPGGLQTIEARVKHQDGHWCWLEITLTNLLADPDINAFVLNSHDITERKSAELSIKESESRYRSLFEGNHAVMLLIDPETTTIVDANPAACHFYGHPRETMRTLRVSDVNTDSQEGIADNIRAAGRHDGYRFVARHRLADGTLRDVEIYTGTIPLKGRSFLYSIVHDITERVEAEVRLRETAQRLALSTEAARIGIWEMDWQSREILVDDRIFGIYGMEKDDVTNVYQAWENAVHPEDLGRIREELRSAVENGKELHSQFRVVWPNGEIRYVEAHARVQYPEGDAPPRVVGVNVDITNRIRAEQERDRIEVQLRDAQKMEAIGRLAGGVAHDFNNMLNVILGCAEMALADLPADHPVYTELLEITKAGKRSADLTRQLLAFSRKQIAEPQPLNLNGAIAEQRVMLGRMIGEDISIVFHPGAGLWNVRIDPSQLDQILANLAVNARDAIHGTGTVTIETQNVTLDESYQHRDAYLAPGDYVMLTFSDTGVGMDAETLERVFEPFFTTKEKGRGTGLGLSTVYGIVKQNDGMIHGYSEPGMGTTFRIYLPRYHGPTKEQAAAAATHEPPHGTETVLIVEDEAQILQLTRRSLEHFGYQVLAAGSPEEAIQLVTDYPDPIHLLLTDVIMPRMNGKELQARLAKMKPGIKSLFMSGYTANIIAHHGVLDEGVAFMHKPFSLETLALKVRAVLDA